MIGHLCSCPVNHHTQNPRFRIWLLSFTRSCIIYLGQYTIIPNPQRKNMVFSPAQIEISNHWKIDWNVLKCLMFCKFGMIPTTTTEHLCFISWLSSWSRSNASYTPLELHAPSSEAPGSSSPKTWSCHVNAFYRWYTSGWNVIFSIFLFEQKWSEAQPWAPEKWIKMDGSSYW